jgi:transposase InsO family protein
VSWMKQRARVEERLRMVMWAQEQGVTAAARRFECSRTTVHSLLVRYEREGLQGLMNRPRGPRPALAQEVVEAIVELKTAQLHRSSTMIVGLVWERYGWKVSRQSVWRVLSSRGLARMQEREPLRRFERPHPNQLWQMDLKEDVGFPFGKAHLLAVVDDASRFCVGGRWIPDKREPTVLGALAGVLERWGLPEAILTDRAAVFSGPATRQTGLTTYQLALEGLGIRAAFARAYRPRTKGKVEKFIQTLQQEFLRELTPAPETLQALNHHWRQWVDHYNHRRPHASLGGRPPAHRFQASPTPAPRELRRLLQVELMRKVTRDATIRLRSRDYPVPPALIGKHVWVGVLGDTITVEHSGTVVATFGA